jgi:hypothetical protein
MKRTAQTVVVTMMLVFAFSLSAWALPYPVSVGSKVQMYANDNVAISYEGHYQAYNTATKQTFGTFCVELNEFFWVGNINTVASVADSAVNGGLYGAVNGADPLSNATKWLYYHFMLKDLEAVTATTKENDYSMQLAVWFLEDELLFKVAANTQYYNEYYADALAQTYVSKALAAQALNAYTGDVKVMNLVEYDAAGNVLYRQSQLVSAPVPEPGTLVLIGVGMFTLAVYGKRRTNRS